jgi:hypothetical protein
MVTRPGTNMLRSPKDILNVRYKGKVKKVAYVNVAGGHMH